MSCFSTVSAVTANSVTDFTKHVNYTAGMILGVDDFTQEFAYLAGRNRWLARDALGYGTISGLSIEIEEDTKEGFRVLVNPGVALSPRGQLICVPSAQCAFLDQWLAAADQTELDKRITRKNTSPPSSPPLEDELTLYVVLCYRDCPDDQVPIPGEPCRSEDELTAPSRIKDDFSLELRYDAPRQAEEKAVRDYVEWLRQIKLTSSGVSTPLEDFIKAIRKEWLETTAEAQVEISSDDTKEKTVEAKTTKTPIPVPSKISLTKNIKTPAIDLPRLRELKLPPSNLQINVKDLEDYMRAALRIWATELRNVLSERKTGCAVEMTGANELDDCLLLTELNFPLEKFTNGYKVGKSKKIEIIEENRPFLIHLRMLQELIFYSAGDLPEPPHNHTLDALSDVAVAAPTDGQHLVFRGDEWVAEDLPVDSPALIALDDLTDVTTKDAAEGEILTFNGTEWVPKKPESVPSVSMALDDLTDVKISSPKDGQRLVFRRNQWISEDAEKINHGDLNGLKNDDHEIYLRADGNRALTGNLQGGNKKIVSLSPATAEGEAVVFQQAVLDGDPAGGDLSGAFPNPTIERLQTKPLKASNPKNGDTLIFDGSAWVTQAQPQIPVNNKTELILPLATVTRTEANTYEIWFNIDAPGNLARVTGFKETHLQIFDESENPTTFTTAVRFRLGASVRNVFIVGLTLGANQPEPDRMRFNFDISEIIVQPNSNRPDETMPLIEYAKRSNIRFEGYLEGRLVTVFVRGTGIRGA